MLVSMDALKSGLDHSIELYKYLPLHGLGFFTLLVWDGVPVIKPEIWFGSF